MATLSELYKKELVNAYGIIAKDNHCVFCGKFIESGYCIRVTCIYDGFP